MRERDRGSYSPLGSSEKKARTTGEIGRVGENGEGSTRECGIKDKRESGGGGIFLERGDKIRGDRRRGESKRCCQNTLISQSADSTLSPPALKTA